MEEWQAKDRRKFVRFPINIVLRCQRPRASSDNGVSCTHDISIKGLGIVSNEKFELGACLKILLRMPDNGEEIQAQGKVVWETVNIQEPGKFRLGVTLEEANLKPIPLVLRTMQMKSR